MNKETSAIVEVLLQNKAYDVVYIDIAGLSAVTDGIIIATTLSDVHSRSLIRKIHESLKESQSKTHFREEGVRSGKWSVLDFTDFMVHLMVPEMRELYNLESIWPEAKVTEFGCQPR
ncbi:ribosome silencing factor [candidate division WOR-3 bacterium]|nr:ribosome silencing factor [candidate division WOR-3 bacterium]